MDEPATALPEARVVWNESRWVGFEETVRRRALRQSDAGAWRSVVRACRKVMRTYSTGFFIVSRFLPRCKRDQVEVIYAAVRYPDEVVDTFPLPAGDRRQRLDAWARAYDRALAAGGLRESLRADVPCFLAAFAEVVRRNRIPPEHYRDFLAAMQADTGARSYDTVDDLIESYVYGSAIVVGYFLTHVYGAREPSQEQFPRALAAARNLGIGLQLTNFARDVGEDHGRNRMYLPREILRAEGIQSLDSGDPSHREALGSVARFLAREASGYYEKAARDLDAFAPDSRIAIRACIDVYGQLNRRILESERGIVHRESVPLRSKLRALPPSKYWRIPLAYLMP